MKIERERERERKRERIVKERRKTAAMVIIEVRDAAVAHCQLHKSSILSILQINSVFFASFFVPCSCSSFPLLAVCLL
jgi:hypothetical protein